jgi:hypothetical protein
MLDKFIYQNHLGHRFVGLEHGVFLNYSDLRDYSWNFDSINNRISRFYHGVTSRNIPLVLCAPTDEAAIVTKNKLMELAETDIEACKPGRLYIGDYYTQGYITASKKSNYLISKRLTNYQLTLTSDDPAWYRETTHVFLPNSMAGGVGAGGYDYPFEYGYDYPLYAVVGKATCNTVRPSAFKMSIYGLAKDPVIMIGGNTYAINGTIEKGETLVIDSIAKTITLVTAAGNHINWFDKRGRTYYIFEPIPTGDNTVNWVGTFGFDLTIVEKRSEPKWI